MSSSRKPVGLMLMTQEMIAGLGNIYRAEVLFKVGPCPENSLCFSRLSALSFVIFFFKRLLVRRGQPLFLSSFCLVLRAISPALILYLLPVYLAICLLVPCLAALALGSRL